MKKILITLVAFTLCAGMLISCANNGIVIDNSAQEQSKNDVNDNVPVVDTEDSTVPAVTSANLQDIYETVISADDFPPMYELYDDELSEYFAISPELFTEFKAAVAEEYPAIERIFIGKLVDKESQNAAIAGLESAIEALEAEYIDYLPFEYEKAKNCSIEICGDYIFYIVCENYKEAVKTVKDSLSKHII